MVTRIYLTVVIAIAIVQPALKKSRNYGLISFSTEAQAEWNITGTGVVKSSYDTNGLEKMIQLLMEKPFECEKCKSHKYKQIVIKPAQKVS